MRKDREQTKLYHKGWYEKNKVERRKQIRQANKIAIARNRVYVDDYLKEHPCIDCGEQDIIVLDFDHVVGQKRYNVSRMQSMAVSLSALKKEIAKCEVRCANCHRRITHKRRNEMGLSPSGRVSHCL